VKAIRWWSPAARRGVRVLREEASVRNSPPPPATSFRSDALVARRAAGELLEPVGRWGRVVAAGGARDPACSFPRGRASSFHRRPAAGPADGTCPRVVVTCRCCKPARSGMLAVAGRLGGVGLHAAAGRPGPGGRRPASRRTSTVVCHVHAGGPVHRAADSLRGGPRWYLQHLPYVADH